MKEKQHSHYIFVAIMFMAFFTAILSYLFFLYIDALQEAQAGREHILEMRVQENELVIDELSFGLNLLVQENESVSARIIEERERRAQEAAVASNQIEKLQQDLEDSKTPGLSEIVSSWSPRVARVSCNFENSNSVGSAVLSPSSNNFSVRLASNRHIFVADRESDALESCRIEFPDDSKNYIISSEDIDFNSDPEIDSAVISISSPSPALLTVVNQESLLCGKSPNIGDSVIILGYPNVGSKDSITATEGILSGVEDEFYITSAKVEKGNSGGAAILTGENCYLGAPSFTAKGVVESLARILKHQSIFK